MAAAWNYFSAICSRIPQDALDFVELKDILVAMVLWAILYRVHKTKNRHRQMERMRLEAWSAITGGLQACGVVFLFLFFVYSPYQHYLEAEKHGVDLQSKINAKDAKIAEMTKELASPTAIYMECNMATLPITIPPRTAIHLVPLNKKHMQTFKWGFYDIRNDSNVERQWPDKAVVRNALKNKANPGIFIWRCDVSNHGTMNVLDISISIKLRFEGENPDVIYQAVITPLDRGDAYTFYLVNDCPGTVSAIWPDTVKLQVLGESKRREVPLRRTFKSPIDQIMMFLEATTRFIVNGPCE